jgi:hypothetical protein
VLSASDSDEFKVIALDRHYGAQMNYSILLLLLAGLSIASPAYANSRGDPRFYASLKRLDPETRLDQVCDYEAMLRIGRDRNGFHPDRAKAEVISKPRRSPELVSTTGGAFRSDGHWYSLSYTCTTTLDHLAVTSFNYQIGKLIPETEWSKYGLWR